MARRTYIFLVYDKDGNVIDEVVSENGNRAEAFATAQKEAEEYNGHVEELPSD